MPKFVAKYAGIGTDSFGHPEVRFTLSSSALNVAQTLDFCDYEINLEVPRKKRSASQNSLLWELIGEISKNESGNYADVDRIYAQILEMAAVKCNFVMIPKDSYPQLKEMVRHTIIKEEEKINDIPMLTVQCFIGTSQMNTEEMSKVIEAALAYAEERNIDIDYWRWQFADKK